MVAGRLSDADLVRRCRTGDRQAFDELVARYHGAIYGYALQRVRDRDAAADVAQQAFVEGFCSLPSLRRPDRFAAWLRTITSRRCADWLERESRRAPGMDDEADVAAPSESADPQRALERKEVTQVVRAAMRRLSRAKRLAVTLFYYDGLSCREVAGFCGVTTSAIKSRLHDARKSLREENERMPDEKASPEKRPEAPGAMVYSGDGCVNVLFWSKKHTKELYCALYPEKHRDDQAFWSRWEHIVELDGVLRLWEHAGAIREEDGKLVGLVPVYTESDHELFAAWHARTSRAVVDRITSEETAVDHATRDFRGDHPDRDNLRHITVIGRLIAQGVQTVLTEGFMGSAHDWGGLGRAFIQGQRGYGLPPSGGYSTHSCSGGDAHLTAFHMGFVDFPGHEILDEYGREYVVALLGRLCESSTSRDALVEAEASTEKARARTNAVLNGMLSARWLQETDGVLRVALPWLPWSVQDDLERLRELAERIAEPIADGADELKVLAAQCSFARCRFADVAYLVASKMTSYVVRDLRRDGVVVPQPDPMPPGWGVCLYVSEHAFPK